jgi:hypothetical protein
MSGTQSWSDPGQNREGAWAVGEQATYAVDTSTPQPAPSRK